MRIQIIGGLLFFAAVGFATPTGTLRIANCDGGGVTVTANTIDWLPVGGGVGCIVTGTPTNITYSGGTLGVGVPGTIKDLPTAPLTDFMTFTGAGDLHFELLGLGPGPANLNCAGLNPFESCSAFAGSPFALTLAADGQQTIVSLRAFGTVTDATGYGSWNGSFSVTIPDLTPAQIASIINTPGGSVTSTDSGSFILTAVPEPGSFALIGGGLIGLALFRRRQIS